MNLRELRMGSPLPKNSMATQQTPIAIVCGFCISVGIGLCATTGVYEQALYSGVGTLAMGICLFPYLSRQPIDVFSPWSFLVLNVLFGVTLRGIYMTLDLPGPHEADSLWMLGHRPEYFHFASVLMLLGLGCMTVGYVTFENRVRVPVLIERWKPTRVAVFTVLALCVALFATGAFIVKTGGLTALSVSAKRTTITDIDLGSDSDYRGFGMLRVLAKLAIVGHMVLLGYGRKFGAPSGGAIWLCQWILLAAACALPFYASSRGTAAIYLIYSLATQTYLGRKLPLTKLFTVVVAVLVLIQAMSMLRVASNPAYRGEEMPSLLDPVHSLIANRNFLELGKSAHIIDAVPDILDWQYGATIARWALAPIPRELWNSKPLICTGPIIGTVIYGNKFSGVPPGLIAELYWNFGICGVPIGCFLFGAFLRWMYDRLDPRSGRSAARILLYVVGPMRFAFDTIGAELGQGILNMAIEIGLMWIAIQFVLEIRKSREPASHARMTTPTAKPEAFST